MADLITSIFATQDPNWADVQAPLNILLTADEKWLAINKANEKAQCLHQKNPNGIPKPAGAITLTEPEHEWWGPSLLGTLQKVHTGRP